MSVRTENEVRALKEQWKGFNVLLEFCPYYADKISCLDLSNVDEKSKTILLRESKYIHYYVDERLHRFPTATNVIQTLSKKGNFDEQYDALEKSMAILHDGMVFSRDRLEEIEKVLKENPDIGDNNTIAEGIYTILGALNRKLH